MPMSLVDCVVAVVVWIQLRRSRVALASFAWFTSRALACLLHSLFQLLTSIVARVSVQFCSGEEIRWALPPKLQRGGPRHCFGEGDHSCFAQRSRTARLPVWPHPTLLASALPFHLHCSTPLCCLLWSTRPLLCVLLYILPCALNDQRSELCPLFSSLYSL